LINLLVTAALNEPLPGYVDNLNGPTGLLLGAGKGVLRSMHCKPAYMADLIPVDLACNGLIVIAWHLANERSILNILKYSTKFLLLNFL
jgi:alcohol-forming fatty acyl-CoA reductase